MKVFILSISVVLRAFIVFSQPVQYSFSSSGRINFPQKEYDPYLFAADESGIYYYGAGRIKGLIGETGNFSATLFKLDYNYAEVYRRNYSQELKGLDFY